jgi:hypothetical protein
MARELDEAYCIQYVNALKEESRQAKMHRMRLNEDNYAMYQMDHDFSHKLPGQSREVLSKTRNATESSKAFFQQALADLDDWYRIVPRDGTDGKGLLITPEEMQKMLNYQMKRANYFSHVGASTQSGLLGSLAISKVRGEMIPKPKFKTVKEGRGKSYRKHVVVSDDKTWELRFDNIRQEDYYPDPSNRKLFEIEECEVDMHVVKALAEGDDAIYDKAAVDQLQPWGSDEQESKKAREGGQNVSNQRMRPKVKLTEMWGTIVDNVTGEVMAENVVLTIANENYVIRKPTENPLWHQRDPIIAAALIEFQNSVWGVALMDAGTKHNRSLTEIFNLMLDSAMKAVWGVGQIRTDVLDDPTQVTDGIRWGTYFKTGAGLPIGGKVVEECITGNIPPEVITMFNLLNQECLTSMKTNDFRMGAQSMRATKATEIITAENAITSEFQGIAKNFEEKKVQPELELGCYTICQNWDRIDKEIFISLYGIERGTTLSQIEPQDLFVQVVNGFKFEVFGISLTLRRQADFRKWTTLLQVIGSSEVLIEAFLKDYSFEALLGEIMTAIDLNKSKIQIKDSGKSAAPAAPQAPNPAMAQPGGAPGGSPDMMSQVPSPGNIPQAGGGLAAVYHGVGNAMNMPSAQAGR